MWGPPCCEIIGNFVVEKYNSWKVMEEVNLFESGKGNFQSLQLRKYSLKNELIIYNLMMSQVEAPWS